MEIWKAKSEFLRFTQGSHMLNQEYFDKFIGMHNINMSIGNKIHSDDFVKYIAGKQGTDTGNLTFDGKKNRHQDLIACLKCSF